MKFAPTLEVEVRSCEWLDVGVEGTIDMSIVMRLLCALAIICPLAAGLFVVHVHQDGVQLGYKLMQQEKRHRELVSTLKQLEVELAAECAPERLKELANKLGLRQPDNSQVVGAVYPAGDTHVE